MDATSASIDPQGLTDRLVIAIEEQDVLYVLHWVKEMNRMNCLEKAINDKHSWKCCSALETIIRTTTSPLSRIILELLLLHGADGQSKALLDPAMDVKNTEALKILLNWKGQGEEQATDARHLSSLSLEDAANWIDSNLPPPLDPEKLTGWRTPPQRPPSLIHSLPVPAISVLPPKFTDHLDLSSNPIYLFKRLPASSTVPAQVSPQMNLTKDPRVRPKRPYDTSPAVFPIPIYASSPTLSPKHARSPPTSPPPPYTSNSTSMSPEQTLKLFRSPSVSSIPASSPQSSTLKPLVESPPDLSHPNPPELVQLHIGNLPLNYPTGDVPTLFDRIGVRCLVKFCRNKNSRAYSFVLVEKDQSNYCIQQINGMLFQDLNLFCSLSQEMQNYDGQGRFIVFDRLPLSPLPFPLSAQTISNQSSNSLLVFNLPLNETDSFSRAVSVLPKFQLYRLFQQNQSVAFVPTGSSIVAQILIRQLDGAQLDDKTLEVVRIEDGISPDQAIQIHFAPLQPHLQPSNNHTQIDQTSSQSRSGESGLSERVIRKRKSGFEEREDRSSKSRK